jgi:hypothetical protein
MVAESVCHATIPRLQVREMLLPKVLSELFCSSATPGEPCNHRAESNSITALQVARANSGGLPFLISDLDF